MYGIAMNEDREIEILDGEGWQFQLQNCLPWLLKKGMVFDIKKVMNTID